MMQNSDEMKIYEETGCLFSCEKFVYELRPKGSLTRDPDVFRTMFPEFEYVSDLVSIHFYFKSGDYMEFEQVRPLGKTDFLASTSVLPTLCRINLSTQYKIYDMNSLIADVGGYLGLLLGHSLLSLYHGLAATYDKMIPKLKAETRQRR